MASDKIHYLGRKKDKMNSHCKSKVCDIDYPHAHELMEVTEGHDQYRTFEPRGFAICSFCGSFLDKITGCPRHHKYDIYSIVADIMQIPDRMR